MRSRALMPALAFLSLVLVAAISLATSHHGSPAHEEVAIEPVAADAGTVRPLARPAPPAQDAGHLPWLAGSRCTEDGGVINTERPKPALPLPRP